MVSPGEKELARLIDYTLLRSDALRLDIENSDAKPHW